MTIEFYNSKDNLEKGLKNFIISQKKKQTNFKKIYRIRRIFNG